MSVPLVVDLDGTVIKTDLFFEAFFLYIQKNPLNFFKMIYWLSPQGRAKLKLEMGKNVPIGDHTSVKTGIRVEALPFCQPVVKYLWEEKKKNRELVLVTGAVQQYAESIAHYLGCFSAVFGVSKERPRMTGKNKTRFIQSRYKVFDYIGDSFVDSYVWRKARYSLVANAYPLVEKKARKNFHVTRVFSKTSHLFSWGIVKFFVQRSVYFLEEVFSFCLPLILWLLVDWDIFNRVQGIQWPQGLQALGVLCCMYFVTFILRELALMQENRMAQIKGLFYFVHPYWGLLFLPFLVLSIVLVVFFLPGFLAYVWVASYFALKYFTYRVALYRVLKSVFLLTAGFIFFF